VSEGVLYLDSSAVIKLVFEEPETSSLSDFLRDWPTRVSSTVANVEVLRTAALVGDELVRRHARAILARVHLVRPDDGLLTAAAKGRTGVASCARCHSPGDGIVAGPRPQRDCRLRSPARRCGTRCGPHRVGAALIAVVACGACGDSCSLPC
jgi:Uncharacterized protein conserved in bacteria